MQSPSWTPGRHGPDFTETTDESGLDLLYTFRDNDTGRFGFGIRIEMVGLAVLREASYPSVEDAQQEAMNLYAIADRDQWVPADWALQRSFLPKLPNTDGTPKHPECM